MYLLIAEFGLVTVEWMCPRTFIIAPLVIKDELLK
jgi:hypothetical protein